MLNSELIGVWESVSERGWEKVDGEIRTEWEEPVKDIRVEFKNNGTLISYEYHDDKWNMDESAKWESKDGKIYSYYYEDDELIEETVTISKLTSTSLIIYMSFKEVYEGVTYETWSEMEYRKVK
ncbi:MAG: hypothetical protein E7099_07810 [Mediterranea massiliensis]|nr:hypothetical protein [Mediterranea massiliensis]